MILFNRKYFIFAVLLFVIELLIAVFVKDGFFRPYFGDYLVVILLYCMVRSVMKASYWKIALGVLLFSYIVEALQYFRILHKLGWDNNTIARTVIGVGFDWLDLVAYSLGVLTIIILEKLYTKAR